jgi:hypothetical protein
MDVRCSLYLLPLLVVVSMDYKGVVSYLRLIRESAVDEVRIGSSICKQYVRNSSRILLTHLLKLLVVFSRLESCGISSVIDCHFTLNDRRVTRILI